MVPGVLGLLAVHLQGLELVLVALEHAQERGLVLAGIVALDLLTDVARRHGRTLVREEEALDLLEDMFTRPVMGLETLWQPMYDPIRDHPRYQSIVDGLELPE